MTLRDDVLPALGLNVTEAAKQLDVSRVALSRLLNGRAAISPEMALRIEACLGVERVAGDSANRHAAHHLQQPHNRDTPCQALKHALQR